MGNCFRRCFEGDSDSEYIGHGYGKLETGGAGPIAYTVVGFTAVARDLLEFETTNKVPGSLGDYVSASKATQRIWYEKLLAAWKRANPAPASAEAVAVLVIQTLQGHHGIEGLLSFYHLPWPTVLVSQPLPQVIIPVASGTWVTEPAAAEDRQFEIQTLPGLLSFYQPPWPTVPVRQPLPDVTKPGVTKLKASGTWVVEPADPEHIQFEIQTLPVKWNENEGDGDGLTVFVDVGKDAREAKNVPKAIKDAVKSRQIARAQKNSKSEIALRQQIEAGKYKVFDGKNGQASCLAHKYKIRLSGVDAPEIGQSYGDEARDILRDLVKDQRLVIHVHDIDKYKRAVGDVYCRGLLIQEELLKKGSVWHYKFHDKRAIVAKLERAAKAARLGLWAHPNPEAPWDWRRRHKRCGTKNGRSFGKNRGA